MTGARLPMNRPPTHPGEMLLEEFLVPLEMSQAELARRIGVSYPRVSEIIHGKRGVTPDTALRLERLFGMSAKFWLGLQQDWDIWHARGDQAKDILSIEPTLRATSVATQVGNRYEGVNFTGQRVRLDGNEFYDCVFADKDLFFFGEEERLFFRGCVFKVPWRLVWAGPAQSALLFISHTYREGTAEQRSLVEELFGKIRAGQDPRGTLRQISWDHLKSSPPYLVAHFLSALYSEGGPPGRETVESLFVDLKSGEWMDWADRHPTEVGHTSGERRWVSARLEDLVTAHA